MKKKYLNIFFSFLMLISAFGNVIPVNAESQISDDINMIEEIPYVEEMSTIEDSDLKEEPKEIIEEESFITPITQENETLGEIEESKEAPSLSVYVAEDAADMLSAVATLSDDDSSRIMVQTNEDLSEVVEESGKAVFYDGTYIIDFENKESADIAKETIETTIDATVIEEDRFQIMSDKPEEIVEAIDSQNVEQAVEGLSINASAPNKKVIALIDTGANSYYSVRVNLTDDSDDDVNGHGTEMAKEIANHANGRADIIAIKAFNDDGTASLSNIYAAVKYAIEANVDIINLSATIYDSEKTTALKELLEQAMLQGITVVAAAGNQSSDVMNYFPANMDGVIAIGASDENGNALSTSNFGEKVLYAVAKSTSYGAAKVSGLLSVKTLHQLEETKQISVLDNSNDSISVIEGDEKFEIANSKKTTTDFTSLDTGNVIVLSPRKFDISKAEFSGDPEFVWVSSHDESKIWNVNTGEWEDRPYTSGMPKETYIRQGYVYRGELSEGKPVGNKSFTLKYKNIATDSDGRSIDAIITFSNFTLHRENNQGFNKYIEYVVVGSAVGGSYTSVYDSAFTNAGWNNGTKMDITYKFVYSGTNTAISENVILGYWDLDQAGFNEGWNKKEVTDDAWALDEAHFFEGVTLKNGVVGDVYVSNNSLLRTNADNTRIVSNGQTNPGNNTSSMFFLANPRGTTVTWTGLACGTGLVSSVYGGNAEDGGSPKLYNLTVNYLEQGTNKVLATKYGPSEFAQGEKHSVKSPSVNNYKLVNNNQSTVSGTMPNKDTVINVYYVKDVYNLTVRYLNKLDNSVLAKQYGPTEYNTGATYNIKSPTVDNFYLVDSKQATVSGTMPSKDTTIDVFYLPYRKVTTEVVNGTIDPSINNVKIGENKTISYKPNNGYALEYIEINGKKVDTSKIQNKNEFKNIQTDQHIKVVYFKPENPIKAVKNDAGDDIHNKYIANGSNLNYEITIKNTGSSKLTYTVTDTIPEGTKFVSADNDGVEKDGVVTWSVPMNASETKVLKFTVKHSNRRVLQIDNQATQTVNGVSQKTNVVTNYRVEIPQDGTRPLKDVFATDGGESINGKYVQKGDTLYYSIVLRNLSSDNKIFTVTDMVPENTELLSMDDDAKVENNLITWKREIKSRSHSEFKFAVKTLADGSVIPNIAKYSVDYIKDEETNRVVNYTPALPEKYVVDSENNDLNNIMAIAGDELTYLIKVKNVAEEDKVAIITDKVPEYLQFLSADQNGVESNGVVKWELPLKAGEEKTVSFKAKVLESGKGQTVENTATVEFDGKSNNTPTVKNPIMPDPVKMVKHNGEDVNHNMIDVGKQLTYEITFENVGDNPKEFTITDKLPNNTNYVDVKDDGTYDPETKLFTWTKTIPAHSSGKVSFVVETVRYGSYIPNIATVIVDSKPLETNKVENTTPDPIVKGDLVSVYKLSDPFSGTAVTRGDIITYTLVAKNTGDSKSGITTITDPLASEITYVEGSASDGGVYKDGIITWTIEGIEPQEARAVTFQAKVNDDVKNVLIRNYANYSTDTDKNPGIKTTNEVIHPVDGKEMVPALDASKLVTPIGMVRKGDILLYTITLGNAGGTAYDTVIVDDIPEGTEFVEVFNNGKYNTERNRVEWNLGTLEYGQFKTVQFSVRVLIKEGVIYNQALFDDNIPEEELDVHVPANSTNITENPVKPHEVHGDLVSVYKSSDPVSGSKVETGQEITYTLTVTNSGEYESGTTIIKDSIPEHTTYVEGSASGNGKYENGQLIWTESNIEPQESRTITFKVKVDEDAHNVIIRNHATYSTDTDLIPLEKQTNEVVHGTDDAPIPPALEIRKFNTPTGFVLNGDEITYRIVLKNNGGTTSKDTVIADSIPEYTKVVKIGNNGKHNVEKDRVEWYIGDVAPGAEATVEFTVKVAGASGTIYNQAEFDNMIPEEELPKSDLTNDSNIVENPIEEPPVIVEGDYVTVHKSSNPKTGTRVERGQEIIYTLTATNTGLTTSKETVIKDTLSNYLRFVKASDNGKFENGTITWTIGALKPKESKSVSFKVTVSETAYNAIIKNHAIYKSDTDKNKEFKNTNETVHATDKAPLPPVLEVVKSADKDMYLINGEQITYTLTIKNNGNEVSKDTVITDVIPEGTEFVKVENGGTYNTSKKRVEWYLGNLKGGEEKKVSFVVKATGAKDIIDNQARFDNNVPKDSLSKHDPKNSSNIVQHIILANTGDLKAEKSVNPTGNVKTGDVVEYTIKLTNTSKLLSKDTVIVDQIPEGTEFVSAENDGKLNGKRVEWYIGNLEAGKDISVKFKVKVTKSSGEIKNLANFGNNIPKEELSKSNPSGKSNEVTNLVNPEKPKEPAVKTGEKGSTILGGLLIALTGLITLLVLFYKKGKAVTVYDDYD